MEASDKKQLQNGYNKRVSWPPKKSENKTVDNGISIVDEVVFVLLEG